MLKAIVSLSYAQPMTGMVVAFREIKPPFRAVLEQQVTAIVGQTVRTMNNEKLSENGKPKRTVDALVFGKIISAVVLVFLAVFVVYEWNTLGGVRDLPDRSQI